MIDRKQQVIIVAGGNGIRMQNNIPKQFILLNGKAIIQWTIEAFINFNKNIEIIIVINKNYIKELNEIIKPLKYINQIDIIEGGETRYDSVKNGITKIKENYFVFVHDAVRCLISKELLERCLYNVEKYGIAIPAISVKDSIRIKQNNIYKSIDRDNVKIIQTPQTFKSEILKNIFTDDYKNIFTDEATVAEHKGYKINLIEGEESNIKITYKNDLIFAEYYLKTNYSK